MRPFEVTVYLKTPLLYPTRRPLYPLCLDSVLAWAAAVEKRGSAALTPSAENLEDIALPLAQSGTVRKYYRASALTLPTGLEQPGAVSVHRCAWVRSQSWLNYGARYAKGAAKLAVETGRGQMRPYSDELIAVTTPYVKFYGVGDPKEVARLFRLIPQLGARRAIGGGEIYSVRISPAPADYSVIGPDGYPARPVPVEEIEGSPLWFRGEATYRPPYWDVRQSTLCYLPLPERWCPTAILPSRLLVNPGERRRRKKSI